MIEKDFTNAMGLIDDELIERSERATKTFGRRNFIKWGSIAACVTVLLASIGFIAGSANIIPLGNESYGVTARYNFLNLNLSASEDCLVYLTEDELFTNWYTAIFEGTIKKIDNIELSFNGEKMHRALAQIKVEQVYRGDLVPGDIAVVLLPCSIGNGIMTSDSGVVSRMREGMRGIFMPIVYGEDSYIEMNGATLYVKELASYGFADGLRYAFLVDGSKLVFSRSAYPTVQNAESLDEIREYVIKMIEKTQSNVLN